MIVSRPLTAQPATQQDAAKLKLFIERARRVHQHLDWHMPAAWLGRRPFYFALDGRQVAGVLAAPPDPPDTAWLRVLAIADGVPAGDVLRAVWPPARRDLELDGVRLVAALAVEEWVGPALAGVGFQKVNKVVVLAREIRSRRGRPAPTAAPAPAQRRPSDLAIERLRADDLTEAGAVDLAAFATPWQVSPQALELALQEASFATAGYVGSPPRLAGFQISTDSHSGGHLARLAVLPQHQGRGIATALVEDVIAHFEARGGRRITVNTQEDNLASLAVYERLGFKRTDEHYGVWQMTL